MANVVEIILKGTDKSSKAFKDAEKSTKGLKDTLGSIAKVGVGVVAAGLAIKKAFDFAEEGAAIKQTSESFDLLIQKVSATPDLLDQLSTASRNTISEFELMSSTATLLAGASGNVATELANATPQLMEIAKAANKLNPALGDTAFMYQSIATGVKRAQPLILDNLGLTLKVGEANEEYAAILGKTVDELTAEEKTIAILNATLKAGDVMINQVGGSTESAVDSFSRLKVAFKEMGDAAKTEMADSLGPFVGWLADTIIEGGDLSDAMDVLGLSFGKYGGFVDRAGKLTYYTEEAILALAEAARGAGNRVHDLRWQYGFLVDEIEGTPDEVPIVITTDPAIETIKKEFLDFDDVIRNIQRTIHIQIVTEKRAAEAAAAAAEQAGTDIEGFIPEFAAGGSMMVPPGYPNDSYKIGVSSGEEVSVKTPIQQQTSNDNSRSFTVNNYISTEIDDQSFQDRFKRMVT